APGVIAVITAADLDIPDAPPPVPLMNMAMTRPFLARDTVRFVGEPVAIVITEERYQGEDAAELVSIDYDPLKPVIDLQEAVSDATILHEAAGTNTTFAIGEAPDPTLFDGCDVVVGPIAVKNQRLAGCPLESRGAAAAWDGERITFWVSTQAPQAIRDAVVGSLGMEPGSVHVITPDVGGGFGPKIGPYPEEILTAWLAKHLNRSVRWTETRGENMVAMGHGRAQDQLVTIGGTRDGMIKAYKLEVLADAGAYPAIGGILPWLTQMMASGVYAIPKIEYSCKVVTTNTGSLVAYRGAGRPEATAAVERAFDMYAAEIGMDAAEVRRKNLIGKDQFPFTTTSGTGTTYDCGDYEQSLDLALAAADYPKLRAEQEKRRASGDTKALGIGVSVYVEVTAGPTPSAEDAKVEVLPDGSAKVYTGTSPHGQGHVTSWSMIASDTLGIPMDKIDVIHGDTDLVPVGVGTFGSRSLQLGGTAVHEASGQVVDLARKTAADLLEANVDDVVLEKSDGTFHVAGTPAVAKTWAEVATAAANDAGLSAYTTFSATSPTYPFGAHVAVVEVDTETGKVTLERIITCDDAGRILNPMIVEGQRHGGIAQGAAQALCEEMLYDAEGNPVTASFADYTIISAAELPSFELVSMETPTPINPLGAKGIGESGTIGSTPAVQSAVVDALAHLGIRHLDMPATPQRVWAAIQAASN
ncbi:MAG: aerobic carbon-monoxide dehydrogenase large subunit, partial [Actinomycetota bacterium]|nr:aerobic carbon-monoxide dehydrogenase large subunit [Actinomycetota bacterium]